MECQDSFEVAFFVWTTCLGRILIIDNLIKDKIRYVIVNTCYVQTGWRVRWSLASALLDGKGILEFILFYFFILELNGWCLKMREECINIGVENLFLLKIGYGMCHPFVWYGTFRGGDRTYWYGKRI
jgi:hypothetical protein